jgi:predicted ATP-dependent serine protease
MFVYQVENGKAIPVNNGPELIGTFTKPFVHWDGKGTPKERLGPPRGFRMSDHKIKSTTSDALPPQINVSLTKLEDLNINPDLFVPMKANTIFDKLISNDGGILPATNIMAAGAPGVGKTTILLDHLAHLQANGNKVLFISAEMNEMDMARYLKRFPNWATLPILFMNNYESHANLVIEKVLEEGYDVVLTDSYTEVNDTVKEHTGWTRGKAEKWFLDLMTQHNKSQAHTAFVTILQLSKGGQFVGSNKLKHMTTSMMKLDWEGGENGRRFLEFSKNRVGDVNKKLYFSFEEGIQFNEARFETDIANDELLKEERKQLETEGAAFDRLFGFDKVTEDTKANVEL